MWGMFCIILSVPQNIVVALNNVMTFSNIDGNLSLDHPYTFTSIVPPYTFLDKTPLKLL
jgi:hypothetical protein